jgi:hypothetical protein
MTFEEILDQALAMLQRRGRVTCRTLQRQFHLDDAALEDLKDALLYAHPHVVDDPGHGLRWRGETTSTPPPAPCIPERGTFERGGGMATIRRKIGHFVAIPLNHRPQTCDMCSEDLTASQSNDIRGTRKYLTFGEFCRISDEPPTRSNWPQCLWPGEGGISDGGQRIL